jgi:iron(III) transport system substrate-binding protein
MKRRFLSIALLAFFAVSCDRSSKEVVLYTSVDEPVARPIVDEFTKRTGVKVVLKTDTEASKTSGLVSLLRAEKANPQADVFWNNEIFHTINLAEEGVLAAYESPSAKDLPGQFKDSGHRWAASGARVRVIARAKSAENVTAIEQLAEPALKGKIGMANPAFGTTSGHVAALFVVWGEDKAQKFLRDLKANDVKLLGGNSEVVKQIANGNLVAGLTDNDDAESMIREGGQLTAVPAGTRSNPGTLAVPSTVSLVAGAKHDADAKKLIDYLLSAEVENKLVEAKFAKMSVRAGASSQEGVPLMKIDYRDVAKMMPRAIDTARKILEGRE